MSRFLNMPWHRLQQTPRTGRHTGLIVRLLAVLCLLCLSGPASPPAQALVAPIKLIVDCDCGVDDSAAIAWLLSQTHTPARILGISTVAGNTTVENAANNVLTLLDTAEQDGITADIPVAIGAAEPLVQPRSQTGIFIHGPDGLWGVGAQHPHDLSRLPRDVPAFYRDLIVANPGATLVTQREALAAQARHDPNFNYLAALHQIVAGTPDNARWSVDIDEEDMHQLFMDALTT